VPGIVMRHGRRLSTVAQQIVVHVDEGLAHGLVDQQPAEAGTVYEEVTFQGAAALGSQRRDEAALILHDLLHLVLDMNDAQLFNRKTAEVVGDEVGIEMPGIVRRPPAV
jgi:hypothetical protein